MNLLNGEEEGPEECCFRPGNGSDASPTTAACPEDAREEIATEHTHAAGKAPTFQFLCGQHSHQIVPSDWHTETS